ncbi:uncharacterized protein LOC144112623 [Amblyomma americanum]
MEKEGEASVSHGAAGAVQEGSHEAASDSLKSPGNLDSDQEEPQEELELHPDASKGDRNENSAINDDIRCLDKLEDDLDEKEEYCLKGERQQGDGEETSDPSGLQVKVLDCDEDKRNPQYIPKKGEFYQHDDRLASDGDKPEIPEEKNEDARGSRWQKKLWRDDSVWVHDKYHEEEQGPKTSEELVSTYGYDIRTEPMPPRGRRRERYGRGPNKYQRNWEDEEAYTPRSGSGRGRGMRGGRRPRGGGQDGNPPFHVKDFPELNVKRSVSESSTTLHQDQAVVKVPTKPACFNRPDRGTRDNHSPQHREWEHVAKSSGTARRGWGKCPPQPPGRLTDTSSKQHEDEVKENKSSDRHASKPAPQSPLKTAESSHRPPSVGRSRAARHMLMEQERSRSNANLHEKTAPKVELPDGAYKSSVFGASSPFFIRLRLRSCHDVIIPREIHRHGQKLFTIVVSLKKNLYYDRKKCAVIYGTRNGTTASLYCGAAGLTRNSAATVAPRGGLIGGTEVAGKPRRYSSLRHQPLSEVSSYTKAAVAAPQLPNAQAPPQRPSQPQQAILTAAHFQGPYPPYPDDYMPPPAQAPAVRPPPSQPAPVMAPPAQMSSPFFPSPDVILSFPPQHPLPYTFPAQCAAPAPAAPPPTQTQAQKPPYYPGDTIYYNTQSQQHKQRPTPLRRPKAAIPIVPPPECHGTVQEGTCEADGSATHVSKSDDDPDDSGAVVTESALQEGLAGQQAVERL